MRKKWSQEDNNILKRCYEKEEKSVLLKKLLR